MEIFGIVFFIMLFYLHNTEQKGAGPYYKFVPKKCEAVCIILQKNKFSQLQRFRKDRIITIFIIMIIREYLSTVF